MKQEGVQLDFHTYTWSINAYCKKVVKTVEEIAAFVLKRDGQIYSIWAQWSTVQVFAQDLGNRWVHPKSTAETFPPEDEFRESIQGGLWQTQGA
ncbi:unnamed protein product [Linum trigynum]|uniref:Uncharacterized protein n=1 Tax=Linum trigynum TaxID=586398 RepID=A0AAV2EVN8_9ROSI